MKTLNLILLIISISLGTINFAMPDTHSRMKENAATEQNNILSNADNTMSPMAVHDITGDGVIDIDDLAVCALEVAAFCQGVCVSDFDTSGFVDLQDLLPLYNHILTNNCN